MKRLFISVAFVSLLLSAKAQKQQTFEYQKSLIEYSSKQQTASNVVTLKSLENDSCKISFNWLHGLIIESKKVRTNEIFSIICLTDEAKQRPYIISNIIAKYKEFQNDFCYSLYLSLKPDSNDISWLKLTVKDTALSNLFVNR